MTYRTILLAAVAAVGAMTAIAAPAMAQDDRDQSYRDTAYAGQAYRGPEDRGGIQADFPMGYHRPFEADDRPPPPPPYGFDQNRGGDFGEREQHLADWMRSGVDQGWLRGWQAHRAFMTLGRIRHEEGALRWRNGGYLDGEQRFVLSQQLDRLGGFVRSAHDDGGGYRRW